MGSFPGACSRVLPHLVFAGKACVCCNGNTSFELCNEKASVKGPDEKPVESLKEAVSRKGQPTRRRNKPLQPKDRKGLTAREELLRIKLNRQGGEGKSLKGRTTRRVQPKTLFL